MLARAWVPSCWAWAPKDERADSLMSASLRRRSTTGVAEVAGSVGTTARSSPHRDFLSEARAMLQWTRPNTAQLGAPWETRVRFASICPAPDARNPLRSRPAWSSPTPGAAFDNAAAAHGKLIRWLTKSIRPLRVGLEATGAYSLNLSLALHRTKRVEATVAKPRAVADFARADLKPRAWSASRIARHAAPDPTCAGRCDTATRSGRARGRVRLGSTLRA